MVVETEIGKEEPRRTTREARGSGKSDQDA